MGIRGDPAMTQAHNFTLDGFLLTGTDAFGVTWTVKTADGWHAAPKIRSERLAKSQQAGSWPSTGHAAERLVTLQGNAFAPDLATLEGAASRLAAVLASGGMGDLVGVSDYGTLSMSVSIQDAPMFDPTTDRSALWQITVAAPDPLKYGPPTYGYATLSTSTPGAGRIWPRVWPTDWGIPAGVTPGAVAVPNAGTAAYWPRLRIDGPAVNPVVTLVESGAWVRLNGTVLAGQWVDINAPLIRNVLLQGQVSIRHWPVTYSGDWLAVPEGGGSVAWTDDGGDPAAKLSVWGYEGAFS
jgi:hypothetical protein